MSHDPLNYERRQVRVPLAVFEAGRVALAEGAVIHRKVDDFDLESDQRMVLIEYSGPKATISEALATLPHTGERR